MVSLPGARQALIVEEGKIRRRFFLPQVSLISILQEFSG
jgi:hypothetical protein